MIGHEGTITALGYFKSFFISGAEDGKINIWKVKEWALLHRLKAHTNGVNDFVIHSSGKIMISVGYDHRMLIWNLMTAKKEYKVSFRYSKIIKNSILKLKRFKSSAS